MSKSRAAIYVFYDKDGIVDSYVTYMLCALLGVCDKLVFVCNGDLGSAGRESVEALTSDLVIRENEGYDAWGFKAGIEYLGWDKLVDYDELVLMNDSVFGPIYPFMDMFDSMDGRGLDFWGITKHGEFIDHAGGKKGRVVPEHIQSYFYAFSQGMFSHSEFKSFWDGLSKPKSWDDAIALFETRFTKHFSDLGFKWDVYVNTDKKLGEFSDIDQTLQMSYELVRDYRCPVLKRKCFSIDYWNFLAYTIGDSTAKAFRYVDEETDYDVNMIWDHILRTVNLRHIKDNLQLNYILPEGFISDGAVGGDGVTGGGGAAGGGDAKAAVFAHITYEDQIEFCIDYISNAAEIADIYITTTSGHMESLLIERFDSIVHKKLKVLVLPDDHKGRDVSALWVALKPFMKEYDYICFVHNKKSSQDKPLTIGRGFAERCFRNTLAGKEYVINIINLFVKNPRLGMLFPPPVIHGQYQFHIANLWGANFKKTALFAETLGIEVPMDNYADPVFPAGGMFWFNTKALRKLESRDWKYDDFPDEPLPIDGSLGHLFERIYCFAAQSEGYYSAWVMTDGFDSTEITALSYMLARKHYSA